MIEGKTPICFQIEQYSMADKEQVGILLYRCSKLYQARSDVTKILSLIIRVFYDPKKSQRKKED